jgi:hypothetical protein
MDTLPFDILPFDMLAVMLTSKSQHIFFLEMTVYKTKENYGDEEQSRSCER